MTALLLDLGNTALKWATSDKPEEPHAYVHCGNDVVPDELLHKWLNLKPERVVGCMVSSEKFAFNITRFFNAHGIKWDWLHSERMFQGRGFSVVNKYDNYEQLGSDRWHAVIGAASLYPNRPILVVHIGTATTADVVIPEGEKTQAFIGGRILPGPSMITEAFDENTLSSGTYWCPFGFSDQYRRRDYHCCARSASWYRRSLARESSPERF